ARLPRKEKPPISETRREPNDGSHGSLLAPMAEFCPHCGAELDAFAPTCPFCKADVSVPLPDAKASGNAVPLSSPLEPASGSEPGFALGVDPFADPGATEGEESPAATGSPQEGPRSHVEDLF